MITAEILKNRIVALVNEVINDENSELYKKFAQMANTTINSLIEEDNENDINWDETEELFGTYDTNGYITLDENVMYVAIDDRVLNPGEEYTLKYIDEYNHELESFDKITTFIA